MADITMGPVLNFRGIDEEGKWCVSALVVYSGRADSPKLRFSAQSTESGEVGGTLLRSFDSFEAWRFEWGIGQNEEERTVEYALGDEAPYYSFRVPAKGASPRIAYASCAGFHDPEGKYARETVNKNAMWSVLKEEHEKEPYHLLIMGGDQVYADQLWRDVEQLRLWVRKPLEEQKKEELTEGTRE
jgi:PhoD related phosphatase